MPATLEQIGNISAATGALSGASNVTMINIRIERDRGAGDLVTSYFGEDGALHVSPSDQFALDGAQYPVLESIWDNDSDAIFDTL